MITDNTLQNGREGIVVHESSAARIGFASTAAAEPNPNVNSSCQTADSDGLRALSPGSRNKRLTLRH
jgi:hypothetical protein